MMKRLLILTLFALAGAGAFADENNKPDPVEIRLQAIEARLARIEALVRASTTGNKMPEAAPGQIRVTILGEVNAPGVYALDSDSPIATLVAMAGGFTKIANQKKIVVVGADNKSIEINAKDAPRAYNLKEGDVVTVGESWL